MAFAGWGAVGCHRLAAIGGLAMPRRGEISARTRRLDHLRGVFGSGAPKMSQAGQQPHADQQARQRAEQLPAPRDKAQRDVAGTRARR